MIIPNHHFWALVRHLIPLRCLSDEDNSIQRRSFIKSSNLMIYSECRYKHLLVILRPESQLHLVLGLGCFIVTWSRRQKKPGRFEKQLFFGLLLRFMFRPSQVTRIFLSEQLKWFVQECSRHVQVKKVYQFHPFIHNTWWYSIQFEAAILASHSCIS